MRLGGNIMKKMFVLFIIGMIITVSGCGTEEPAEASEGTEAETTVAESAEVETTEAEAKETMAENTTAATAEEDISDSDSGVIELTLEELAAYDGTNGMPAYIAVEGVIYDVTDAGPWSGGKHNGFKAGEDHTENMKNAPHGYSKLKFVTEVGVIVE